MGPQEATKEEKGAGNIAWSVYLRYFRAGSNWFAVVYLVLISTSCQVLFSMSDVYWQFQAWFEVYRGDEPQVEDDPEDDAEGDGISHPAGSKMPSRQTFSRAWHHSWSKVIRLTFPPEPTCCQNVLRAT